uniref:Uncharacterized protein n=1 Tax=Arundo donax TaxID=35708 RepID=A0A0A8ZG83_ARUDO
MAAESGETGGGSGEPAVGTAKEGPDPVHRWCWLDGARRAAGMLCDGGRRLQGHRVTAGSNLGAVGVRPREAGGSR